MFKKFVMSNYNVEDFEILSQLLFLLKVNGAVVKEVLDKIINEDRIDLFNIKIGGVKSVVRFDNVCEGGNMTSML